MTLIDRLKGKIKSFFTAGAIETIASSKGLTKTQKLILEQIIRNSTSEQRLVTRSLIIIARDQKLTDQQIASDLNIVRKTVRKWRRRWDESHEFLNDLEAKGIPEKDYRKVIAEVLNDEPRSGAPYTFTAMQVTHIVAIACEVLDDSDSAVSHWTHGYLAEEAIKRGIVESISRSSVTRFLAEAAIKPHLNRYWLNSPDKGTEEFDHRSKIVCNAYEKAPKLAKEGVHTVSTDEKTGIQAIKRDHTTHPAEPNTNRPKELREYNYDRHGTLCLIGNFDVVTGKIIAPTLSPTRTEDDFVNHIARTVELDPTGRWIFITDQLNTHQSTSLVEFVAKQCGIDSILGVKGKEGILASMKSRKEFLSDKTHRISFVYTPKHASWLNQIEIWFSILVRRLLKRGSFKSLDHLRERILRFIEFFNETMAKPFKWTYKGQPLAA